MHSVLAAFLAASIALLSCGGCSTTEAATQNPSPMRESARQHLRLTESHMPAGDEYVLPGVVDAQVKVFVPNTIKAGGAFDLLIHFHGAAFVPAIAGVKQENPLVSVAVHAGAGSSANERVFADADAFPALVAGVIELLTAKGKAPAQKPRIFLSAFSAGYGAVRAILPHHLGAISGVVLLDGLHTDYEPAGTVLHDGGRLNAGKLDIFLPLARQAVEGEKRMLVTHSAIFPGTYASTTESVDYLLDAVGAKRKPELAWGPGGMQLLSRAESGGFTVLGFAGNTAPDHVDHFHGLPDFLTLLLGDVPSRRMQSAAASASSRGYNLTVEAQVAPRLALLFSEADLPRMRANAQLPMFASFWEEQLAKDVAEDNNFFRESFIYVMTGDSTRGQNARRAVLETANLEYWNDFVDGGERLGFLRAGRVTAWMALAYDWLYDLFTEAERATIRTAIAEKGCVPLYRALYGFKYPDSVKGWSFASYSPRTPRYDIDMSRWPEILSKNNFRAIINGGLTLGAIVLEDHDERAPEWQEIALESIAIFNALLKDDGSYDEAVSYLNYAMTYQLHAMEGARRKLGVDLFDSANFQGMMDYVLAMYLPSDLYGHGSITFGDAGGSLQSAPGFWVARNSRDGLSQYIAENLSDHSLLSLLYYDPDVLATAPGEAGHFAELDLDWVISRSGYAPDDFVAGMRSGGPMNHEHGDRNSIQLKAYREILLADHRRLTYYGQDPEWEMRRSLGHNTVLVDGVGHQYHNGEEGTNESKSYAKIVRSGQREGHHFWASDATQGYKLLNADVLSVTRTIISFPSLPGVVVLDKVMKETTPSIVSSRWHAENADGLAELTTGDRTFTIARPNARLQTVFAGTAGSVASVGQFDSANKEYPFRFVEVAAEQPSTETFNLTVALPLQRNEPNAKVDIERTGDRWTIRIQKHGKTTTVVARDDGALPEFEVDTRR